MRVKAEIYSTRKAYEVERVREILKSHRIKSYIMAYSVTDPRLYHKVRHASTTSYYDYKICVSLFNYRRAKRLLKKENI